MEGRVSQVNQIQQQQPSQQKRGLPSLNLQQMQMQQQLERQMYSQNPNGNNNHMRPGTANLASMLDRSYNVNNISNIPGSVSQSHQQFSFNQGNNNNQVNGNMIGQSLINNGNNMGGYSVHSSMLFQPPQQQIQTNRNFGAIPSNPKNLFAQKEAFKCDCGQDILQRHIINHYQECQQFQSKYEGLIKCLNYEIGECTDSEQSLKNLKSILGFFVDQISEKLKFNSQQQQLNQSVLNNGANQNAMNNIGIERNSSQIMGINNNNYNSQHKNQPHVSSSDNMLSKFNIPNNVNGNGNHHHNIFSSNHKKDSNMFEQKIKEFKSDKKSNNLHKMNNSDIMMQEDFNDFEEVKESSYNQNDYNDYYEPVQHQEVEKCCYCNNAFTREEESSGQKLIIMSTECYHMIHKKCLISQVFENMPKTQTVPCPDEDCGKHISEYEYSECLSEDQKAKLDKMVNDAILNQGGGFVACKCGNIMELEEGNVDYNQKDDQGKKITKEAAKHMAKYRVRCNQCSENFCSGCKEYPYHISKTCEQFREFKNSRKCRFCGEKINPNAPLQSGKPAFKDVCPKQECVELMNQSCDKIHRCGHLCNGFAGEKKCLPCLHEDCVNENPELTLNQNAGSYCSICFVEGLGDRPSVQLDCQHIFHLDCVMSILKKRWPGPRIVFNFLNCTSCKRRVRANYCPQITKELQEAEKYEKDLQKKAVERGKHEGIDKHEKLKDPNYAYYNKFQDYCLFKLSYYECFKCKLPYFGGMKDCENAQEENKQEYKKEDLVCASCSAVAVGGGVQNCPKHGLDYIEFKCKFCCNIAQWFCWGTTHFCESCHTRQNNGDYVSRKKKSELPKCPGIAKCPLKINHPENGEEFPLGCALCRNLKANAKDF